MWDPSTITFDRRDPTGFGSIGDAPQPCRLVLYSGPTAGRSVALAEGRNLIGRSPDSQLMIASPGVSRHHAEITVAGEVVTLRDLDSANGSFRNHQRVSGTVALAEGDLIRLGGVLLKYYSRRSVDALLHDRLYRMAMVDAGTGVYNRRWFTEALHAEFTGARRGGWPLALIAFDFDHFKAVNDRFGHSGGDVVLKECVGAVAGTLRDGGLLSRVGGEEFAVLLPRVGAVDARAVAERIRATVETLDLVLPVADPDGARIVEHRQTLSLGVAELTPALAQPADLAEAADRQLYAAKEGGRNRVAG